MFQSCDKLPSWPKYSGMLGIGTVLAPAQRLALGNDVNANDSRDYTALHRAAFRGDTELLRFPLGKDAKIDVVTDVVTKDGWRAADRANGPAATAEQYPDTIALLVKLGSLFANNCHSSRCLIVDGKDRKKPGE
jgi:hypothetical protein